MMGTDLNAQWAHLLVEELIRCGVRQFCIAPGSRSTPLTVAVAQHPQARTTVHYDERGTAFFALGYARATGDPAAWITTSGTALANGFPAVIEAASAGVPMVLLTADRPPELRHTGANQTIDQVKLFGEAVRWFFDVPAPTDAIDLAFVLTTVDQAVHRARQCPGGPVHLNCMFREPLVPEREPEVPDSLKAWAERGHPYTAYPAIQKGPESSAFNTFATSMSEVERGLLVVGSLKNEQEARAVASLSKRLQWPLLPDILSGLRVEDALRGAGIAYYDHLLESAGFQQQAAPKAVLHIGGRPTSKRLLRFLNECRPPIYAVVQNHANRYDPSHQVSHRFDADIATFCSALEREIPNRARGAYQRWWQDAAQVLAEVIPAVPELSVLQEPTVARLIAAHIPAGHGWVLASSMPVRDADMFVEATSSGVFVTANRGASGIDGLVATAAGYAAGLQAPVTLLIGDLALLHDLNSLALLRDIPVVVVVLNNNGGGIFHFLPIAAKEQVFEPFFGTPHGMTFEHAAHQFGVRYQKVEDTTAFVEAYQQACARQQSVILEVQTEREANHAIHEQILTRCREAVEAWLRV